MLVRLSMRRQCRSICVKQTIYFSRSWRECPQRNFGRKESDSVSLHGCRVVIGPEPLRIWSGPARLAVAAGSAPVAGWRSYIMPPHSS